MSPAILTNLTSLTLSRSSRLGSNYEGYDERILIKIGLKSAYNYQLAYDLLSERLMKCKCVKNRILYVQNETKRRHLCFGLSQR